MRLSLVQFVRKGANDPRVVHSGLGKYTTDYSNLPQRYIKKHVTKVEWKSPLDDPRFVPKMKKHLPKFHGLERPWTNKYWRETEHDSDKPRPVVEPIREEDWMWFRGDIVEVLKGPDKGKFGIIVQIVQERNWVIVEGLNCTYETMGAKDEFPGIMQLQEEPLLVTTDIRLVDPSTDLGTKVEWRYTEEGHKVRICVATGTEIPIPTAAEETIDYKAKSEYKADSEKDTIPKVVEKPTYEPSLATFEMDIMNSMGIKEERIAKKTYWY